MDNHIPMFIDIKYISIFFFFFLIIITFPTQSHSQPKQPPQSVYDYSTCRDIKNSYSCGKDISNISYPFWGQDRNYNCGSKPFYLHCNPKNNVTTIQLSSQNFTVLDINTEKHTMKLKRTDLSYNICSPQFNDTYLSPTLFQYLPIVNIIAIYYNCTSDRTQYSPEPSLCESNKYSFGHVGDEAKLFEEIPSLKCQKHIKVPVELGADFPLEMDFFEYHELERVLNHGFEVKYNVNEECLGCLGIEGRDCSRKYFDKYNELCYNDKCQDGSIASSTRCSSHHKRTLMKLFIMLILLTFTLTWVAASARTHLHRDELKSPPVQFTKPEVHHHHHYHIYLNLKIALPTGAVTTTIIGIIVWLCKYRKINRDVGNAQETGSHSNAQAADEATNEIKLNSQFNVQTVDHTNDE